MLAAPSVLTPNAASLLAAVASDADGDTLSFSWGADCPGMFSESTTRTPSFTLLAPPPMGNRCTLSVSVSDGRGGQHTGTLSLLVGPAPRANVAPHVDTTFKSSDLAASGEVVTVGLTAHDPESTALTFTWTSSQGVILATRGTSSSSEIDWKAPLCLEGAAVLTAIITDAGGATTRQQFSITPRAGASCGGLAVSGIQNIHRVRADGSVSVVPVDLTGVTVGAWVPTPDGLSYNWRPGSGQINGTFLIPGVESTPYLLQFGATYHLWTSRRTLDLSRAELGRPDVQLEPDGTQLSMQISGLSAWQLNDDVQFTSANAGLGYFSYASCASTSLPGPVEGDTTFLTSIDYVASLQGCGSVAARIDAARGDVLYANQMVARSDPATGADIQELRRSFQTGSLAGPDSGTLLLSGSMTALPTTSQTVDYRASSFEALALAAHPTATLTATAVNIGTLPGYGQLGAFAGWPDLAYLSDSAGKGDLLPVFTYGTPFPSAWPQFITAQTSARVSYSVPLPEGGTSTPRSFTVYTYAQQPLENGPVTPLVGPPRALQLNGLGATGILTSMGLTPLASWTAPSVGTPSYYVVRVYQLFATSTGSTSRLQVAGFTTPQTQLRLPPGVLVPGKHYYLQISSNSQSLSDPSKPNMLGTVYHSSSAVTGRFQP
jgi:hypothetical protein